MSRSKQAASAPAPAADGFLKGVKVFVPPKGSGIPSLLPKISIWKARVAENAGSFTQDHNEKGITHVLVGETGMSCVPAELQPRPPGGAGSTTQQAPAATTAASWLPHQPVQTPGGSPSASKAGTAGAKKRKRPVPYQGCHVHYRWLEECLQTRRVVETADFPVPGTAAATSSATEDPPAGGAGKGSAGGLGSTEVPFMQRWLGEAWHPACEEMSQVELALQPVYNEERCTQLGNEPLAQALKELSRYEQALDGNEIKKERGEKVVNYRLLQYARVAAAVRGCSYKIHPGVVEGQLPFVGEAIAKRINDILTRGSCDVLDACRADLKVPDSKGNLRPGTEGARMRALFQRLPGIGVATAKRLWELGLRSFEDIERAAEPGGPLAQSGASGLDTKQRYSLEHREELLEGLSAAEVEEMHQVIDAALTAVSGPGWRVEVVGGASRSHANKDSDLLCTHLTLPMDGLIEQLRDHLIREGRLLSEYEAFINMQKGKMRSPLDVIKMELASEKGKGPIGHQNMDRYDHIYGIVRTSCGRVRRLDVILAPPDVFPFALIGWIGSRQFNRFMRQHAKDLGMHFSSHRLLRVVDGRVYVVPDEKPPLNRKGEEWWPPGWGPGRQVQTQHDIFELLGIPYHEPWERDCF